MDDGPETTIGEPKLGDHLRQAICTEVQQYPDPTPLPLTK